VSRVASLFERESPLFKEFPRYEERREQKELSQLIEETFGSGGVALLEAGTGVGKSFAYLLPSLLLAHTKGERVVISTHTIHLQEQLLKKDLPFLLNALGFDIEVSLAMGLSNYVCLRHLDELEGEKELIEKFDQWKSQGGSLRRSDLPFIVPADVTDGVFADYDSCSGQKCPHYEKCPFFLDRKKAEGAKIIVANHHLLLTDLAKKQRGEKGILPNYKYVVIDEAHHLEQVATDLFASSVSNVDMFRLFGRLYSENKKGRKGALNRLLQKVEGYFSKEKEPYFLSRFREKILIEYPALRERGMMEIHRLFETVDRATPLLESKWRLFPQHKTAEEIQTLLQQVKTLNEPIPLLVSGLLQELKTANDEKLLKEVEPLFQEVETLIFQFSGGLSTVKQILDEAPAGKGKVQWFAREGKKRLREELRMGETTIEQGEFLDTILFSQMKGVVLTSATLGGKGGFAPLAERLGLKEKGWKEKSFPSPFHYEKQALFLGMEGLPLTDSPQFVKEAEEVLLSLLPSFKGGTFFLFTSFQQLFALRSTLETALKEKGFQPLFQGDLSRRKLIEQFQTEKKPILFGTDSFWEGVDIPNGKLKTVVLMKLPFKSPKDPIIEARSEALEAEGKNPFVSYHLPEALIKFKQGFGRLIRSRSDKGIVLCLDSRLKEKGYGKQFLNALPPCPKHFVTRASVKETMDSFWKN